MNWGSSAEFFAMGGYGFYVWGSFLVTAACLAERIAFFQPLNRLARRRMQESAEYLCDEWAVRRTGSGVFLAKCLAKVAEWMDASPRAVPVAGMAEERSHLVARVRRLLDATPFPAAPGRRLLAAASVSTVLIALLAVPGVSLARHQSNSGPTAIPEQSDQSDHDAETGRLEPAKVGEVGGRHRCAHPESRRRDHAIVQRAAPTTSEVEQLGGDPGITSQQGHRLLHHPGGELDVVPIHRAAQELRPAHCTDPDRLPLSEPLAEPPVLGGATAQRADQETRVEMDHPPRASLRAEAARRSDRAARAHARARAGVSFNER